MGHQMESVGKQACIMRRIWSIDVLAGARAEMSKNSGGESKTAGDPEGCARLRRAGEHVEAKRKFLRAGELIGKGNVAPEGLMGGDEIAAGSGAGVIGADAAVNVAGIEGNIGVLGRTLTAGPDRSDIEGERARGQFGRRLRWRRGCRPET